MEVEWISPWLVIARIGDRSIRVDGELVNHDPDFLIYARGVTSWDDGIQISESERAALLDEVVDAASRQGWKFDISWEEFDLKEAIEKAMKQEREAQGQPLPEGGEPGEARG